MPVFKGYTEFTELFVLENSSVVYGIAHYPEMNPGYYGNGIVWRYEGYYPFGLHWVSTMKYYSAGCFRNRVLKIKNIKLLHKTG